MRPPLRCPRLLALLAFTSGCGLLGGAPDPVRADTDAVEDGTDAEDQADRPTSIEGVLTLLVRPLEGSPCDVDFTIEHVPSGPVDLCPSCDFALRTDWYFEGSADTDACPSSSFADVYDVPVGLARDSGEAWYDLGAGWQPWAQGTVEEGRFEGSSDWIPVEGAEFRQVVELWWE